jgi:hypothetical protein
MVLTCTCLAPGGDSNTKEDLDCIEEMEPYALTQPLIDELTQVQTNAIDRNTFHLKGLSIALKNIERDSIILSIVADPRLDLWNGRTHDMASGHIGSMNVGITAIADARGTNIHDKSRDMPWADRVVIYRMKDGRFMGTKTANFLLSTNATRITQISGIIKLSLPVNLSKYVIKAGSPLNAKALLDRGDVRKVRLEGGIDIEFSKAPPFACTVTAFNKDGERVGISGMGDAGPIRWYHVNTGVSVDKVVLFIPEKMVSVQVPFTIDVR